MKIQRSTCTIWRWPSVGPVNGKTGGCPWRRAAPRSHRAPDCRWSKRPASTPFSAPRRANAACPAVFRGERSETADVAAVLPEILRAFAGRLRGAVVAREAEAKLKPRFQVLCLRRLRSRAAAIRSACCRKSWTGRNIVQKIESCLDPAAPVLTGAKGPKVEFTHTHPEPEHESRILDCAGRRRRSHDHHADRLRSAG